MAVLLLDWDFHIEGDDDPEYNKKAAAANKFAKRRGGSDGSSRSRLGPF